MTFATSIQLLLGPHSATGGGTTCFVDWSRARAWLGGGGGNYLTRINILDGSEEAFQAWSTYGGEDSPIGIDGNGNLYVANNLSTHFGGVNVIDGTTLALTATNSYSDETFGDGGWASVPLGGVQYMLDTGLGGGIIGPLEQINILTNGVQTFNATWPVSQPRSLVCPSQAGSSIGFLLNAPADGSTTQQITLSSLTVSPVQALTVLGSLNATAIDAAWTSIIARGMCLDQSDGNPIVCVNGSGSSTAAYAVKISKVDGHLIWKCALPDAGGIDSSWNLSSILHQKLYVVTPSNSGSPPVTVTTINTSDGSSTSYTSNLNGLIIFGGQMSSDSLGTIAVFCGYTEGSGSPVPLNSTPSGWVIRWALLYVAPAPAPSRGYSYTELRSLITGPNAPTPIPPVTQDYRITQDSDTRITMSGETRETLP